MTRAEWYKEAYYETVANIKFLNNLGNWWEQKKREYNIRENYQSVETPKGLYVYNGVSVPTEGRVLSVNGSEGQAVGREVDQKQVQVHLAESVCMSKETTKLTITHELPLHKGFKYTGEFRRPKTGEWYLGDNKGSPIKASSTYCPSDPRFILRKNEPYNVPCYFPRGWWMYKTRFGFWFITDQKPEASEVTTGFYHSNPMPETKVLSPQKLCDLYGEVFVPPTSTPPFPCVDETEHCFRIK